MLAAAAATVASFRSIGTDVAVADSVSVRRVSSSPDKAGVSVTVAVGVGVSAIINWLSVIRASTVPDVVLSALAAATSAPTVSEIAGGASSRAAGSS